MIIKCLKERSKILYKIKTKFTGGGAIKTSKLLEIMGDFTF